MALFEPDGAGSAQALATASKSAEACGPSVDAESTVASAWPVACGVAEPANEGMPLVVAYQAPVPPPASTVVPRINFAASPIFPAISLASQSTDCVRMGTACAHHKAAFSSRIHGAGKGHFQLPWRLWQDFTIDRSPRPRMPS